MSYNPGGQSCEALSYSEKPCASHILLLQRTLHIQGRNVVVRGNKDICGMYAFLFAAAAIPDLAGEYTKPVDVLYCINQTRRPANLPKSRKASKFLRFVILLKLNALNEPHWL